MRQSKKHRKDKVLVAVWVPETLLIAVDTVVGREDSDRSKFIRNAIRQRILASGVQVAIAE